MICEQRRPSIGQESRWMPLSRAILSLWRKASKHCIRPWSGWSKYQKHLPNFGKMCNIFFVCKTVYIYIYVKYLYNIYIYIYISAQYIYIYIYKCWYIYIYRHLPDKQPSRKASLKNASTAQKPLATNSLTRMSSYHRCRASHWTSLIPRTFPKGQRMSQKMCFSTLRCRQLPRRQSACTRDLLPT